MKRRLCAENREVQTNVCLFFIMSPKIVSAEISIEAPFPII